MSYVNAGVNINVTANTKAAQAQLAQVQAQLKSLATTMAGAGAAGTAAQRALQGVPAAMQDLNSRGWSTGVRNMTTEAGRLQKALDRGTASSDDLRRMTRNSSVVNQMAADRVRTLQTRYAALGQAVDGTQRVMRAVPNQIATSSAATQTFGKQATMSAQKAQIMSQRSKLMAQNMVNAGKNMQWAGRQMVVGFGVPFALAAGGAVSAFAEVEAASISFKRVYGDFGTTTAQKSAALNSVMQQLVGTMTEYGVAAKDTIDVAARVAAVGYQGEDMLSVTRETLRLATLGQMDYNTALEATIAVQTAFDIKAKDMAKTTDFLNAAENQTILSMEDMAIAFPRAASVIKGFSGDVEDLAFLMVGLREGGVKAEHASNSLKSMLSSMVKPTQQTSDMMEKLGIDYTGVEKALNKGNLIDAFKELNIQMKDLGQGDKQRFLTQAFGKYQYARAVALFKSLETLRKGGDTQLDQIEKLDKMSAKKLAAISEGELAQIADSNLTKMQGAFERLKVALVPIGDKLAGIIATLLDGLAKIADWFGKNDMAANILLFTAAGLGAFAMLRMLGGVFLNLVGSLRLFGRGLWDSARGIKYLTTDSLTAVGAQRDLSAASQLATQNLQRETAAAHALSNALLRLAGISRGRGPGGGMPGTPGTPGAPGGPGGRPPAGGSGGGGRSPGGLPIIPGSTGSGGRGSIVTGGSNTRTVAISQGGKWTIIPAGGSGGSGPTVMTPPPAGGPSGGGKGGTPVVPRGPGGAIPVVPVGGGDSGSGTTPITPPVRGAGGGNVVAPVVRVPGGGVPIYSGAPQGVAPGAASAVSMPTSPSSTVSVIAGGATGARPGVVTTTGNQRSVRVSATDAAAQRAGSLVPRVQQLLTAAGVVPLSKLPPPTVPLSQLPPPTVAPSGVVPGGTKTTAPQPAPPPTPAPKTFAEWTVAMRGTGDKTDKNNRAFAHLGPEGGGKEVKAANDAIKQARTMFASGASGGEVYKFLNSVKVLGNQNRGLASLINERTGVPTSGPNSQTISPRQLENLRALGGFTMSQLASINTTMGDDGKYPAYKIGKDMLHKAAPDSLARQILAARYAELNQGKAPDARTLTKFAEGKGAGLFREVYKGTESTAKELMGTKGNISTSQWYEALYKNLNKVSPKAAQLLGNINDPLGELRGNAVLKGKDIIKGKLSYGQGASRVGVVGEMRTGYDGSPGQGTRNQYGLGQSYAALQGVAEKVGAAKFDGNSYSIIAGGAPQGGGGKPPPDPKQVSQAAKEEGKAADKKKDASKSATKAATAQDKTNKSATNTAKAQEKAGKVTLKSLGLGPMQPVPPSIAAINSKGFAGPGQGLYTRQPYMGPNPVSIRPTVNLGMPAMPSKPSNWLPPGQGPAGIKRFDSFKAFTRDVDRAYGRTGSAPYGVIGGSAHTGGDYNRSNVQRMLTNAGINATPAQWAAMSPAQKNAAIEEARSKDQPKKPKSGRRNQRASIPLATSSARLKLMSSIPGGPNYTGPLDRTGFQGIGNISGSNVTPFKTLVADPLRERFAKLKQLAKDIKTLTPYAAGGLYDKAKQSVQNVSAMVGGGGAPGGPKPPPSGPRPPMPTVMSLPGGGTLLNPNKNLISGIKSGKSKPIDYKPGMIKKGLSGLGGKLSYSALQAKGQQLKADREAGKVPGGAMAQRMQAAGMAGMVGSMAASASGADMPSWATWAPMAVMAGGMMPGLASKAMGGGILGMAKAGTLGGGAVATKLAGLGTAAAGLGSTILSVAAPIALVAGTFALLNQAANHVVNVTRDAGKNIAANTDALEMYAGQEGKETRLQKKRRILAQTAAKNAGTKVDKKTMDSEKAFVQSAAGQKYMEVINDANKFGGEGAATGSIANQVSSMVAEGFINKKQAMARALVLAEEAGLSEGAIVELTGKVTDIIGAENLSPIDIDANIKEATLTGGSIAAAGKKNVEDTAEYIKWVRGFGSAEDLRTEGDVAAMVAAAVEDRDRFYSVEDFDTALESKYGASETKRAEAWDNMRTNVVDSALGNLDEYGEQNQYVYDALSENNWDSEKMLKGLMTDEERSNARKGEMQMALGVAQGNLNSSFVNTSFGEIMNNQNISSQERQRRMAAAYQFMGKMSESEANAFQAVTMEQDPNAMRAFANIKSLDNQEIMTKLIRRQQLKTARTNLGDRASLIDFTGTKKNKLFGRDRANMGAGSQFLQPFGKDKIETAMSDLTQKFKDSGGEKGVNVGDSIDSLKELQAVVKELGGNWQAIKKLKVNIDIKGKEALDDLANDGVTRAKELKEEWKETEKEVERISREIKKNNKNYYEDFGGQSTSYDGGYTGETDEEGNAITYGEQMREASAELERIKSEINTLFSEEGIPVKLTVGEDGTLQQDIIDTVGTNEGDPYQVSLDAQEDIDNISSTLDAAVSKTRYMDVNMPNVSGTIEVEGKSFKVDILENAQGGYIKGPGTGTSDDILSWLSNGEYVVRAASVNKYGTGMLDKINAGKYNKGGLTRSKGKDGDGGSGSSGGSDSDSGSDSGSSEEKNPITKAVNDLKKSIKGLNFTLDSLTKVSKEQLKKGKAFAPKATKLQRGVVASNIDEEALKKAGDNKAKLNEIFNKTLEEMRLSQEVQYQLEKEAQSQQLRLLKKFGATKANLISGLSEEELALVGNSTKKQMALLRAKEEAEKRLERMQSKVDAFSTFQDLQSSNKSTEKYTKFLRKNPGTNMTAEDLEMQQTLKDLEKTEKSKKKKVKQAKKIKIGKKGNKQSFNIKKFVDNKDEKFKNYSKKQRKKLSTKEKEQIKGAADDFKDLRKELKQSKDAAKNFAQEVENAATLARMQEVASMTPGQAISEVVSGAQSMADIGRAQVQAERANEFRDTVGGGLTREQYDARKAVDAAVTQRDRDRNSVAGVERQAQLGTQQAALGVQQANLGVQSAELTIEQNKLADINEKYDEQAQILQEVNAQQAQLEAVSQSRLAVSASLASGDIAAAAAAMRQSQQQQAGMARDSRALGLEKAREAATKGLKDNIEKVSKEIRDQEATLGLANAQLGVANAEIALIQAGWAEADAKLQLVNNNLAVYDAQTTSQAADEAAEWVNVANNILSTNVATQAFKDDVIAKMGEVVAYSPPGTFTFIDKFTTEWTGAIDAAVAKAKSAGIDLGTVPGATPPPATGSTPSGNDEGNKKQQWKAAWGNLKPGQKKKLKKAGWAADGGPKWDRLKNAKDKKAARANAVRKLEKKKLNYLINTPPRKFSQGGFVPGYGNKDSVFALLTPGEFVVNKAAAQQYGALLKNINNPNYGMSGKAGTVSTVSKDMGGNEYNYSVTVNAGSNASADDIARATMSKIQEYDRMSLRSSTAASTSNKKSRVRGTTRNG